MDLHAHLQQLELAAARAKRKERVAFWVMIVVGVFAAIMVARAILLTIYG